MVSHHPAKFGDHRYCGSGDIMFLGKFQMLSLKSAITVYFQRTWVESTRHIILLTSILVTRGQGSNWTKL